MKNEKNNWLLWVGGIILLLVFGLIRIMGKEAGIFGLATTIGLATAILAYFVIKYINKNW